MPAWNYSGWSLHDAFPEFCNNAPMPFADCVRWTEYYADTCKASRNGAEQMPESIDWPRIRPPRSRRRFLLILVVLGVIFFGGRTALSYYVDALWFGSLGYGDVFRKTLTLQWIFFAAFFAVAFLFLYGWFLALRRAYQSDLPEYYRIVIGD